MVEEQIYFHFLLLLEYNYIARNDEEMTDICKDFDPYKLLIERDGEFFMNPNREETEADHECFSAATQFF